MKSKKVLFISPTPTHPTNAGNRQHIKSLITFFKEQKWEVHFLYLAYEDYDEATMRSFTENLYLIPKNEIFQNKKTIAYVFQKLNIQFCKIKRTVQFYCGIINKEQYLYNSEVDNHFSVFLKPVIKSLQKKNDFPVVVCEYAFISKSLDLFKKSVYKILDTHDRFTDRFQTYLDNNLQPDWVSLFKDQERKALQRANLNLAVLQKDADYFSKLCGRETLIFNYIPEITDLPEKVFSKKLLYIASENKINIATINHFIEKIFPLILKIHPETKLIIGGTICQKLKQDHNIELKGSFDDLKSFYESGDIVINPELSGTGYKVKTMEALTYGMPIVATTAGAFGVTSVDNNHLFIADSPQEFAEIIDRLFCDPELIKITRVNAYMWIKAMKGRNLNDLTTHLSNDLNKIRGSV